MFIFICVIINYIIGFSPYEGRNIKITIYHHEDMSWNNNNNKTMKYSSNRIISQHLNHL